MDRLRGVSPSSWSASIAYLRTRNPKWDWLARFRGGNRRCVRHGRAGHRADLGAPVWGIWWTWDARLTSTFVLWVLYVCYLLLRNLMDEPERRAVISAVFGIFAAFDIPLVYFSIWFFRTQHPQPVIGDGGSLDPRMCKRAAALLGGDAGRDGAVDAPALSPGGVAPWEVDDLRAGSGAKQPKGSAAQAGKLSSRRIAMKNLNSV